MGESFVAWPEYADGKDEGPWCELLDCATGEVRWEDSETGKDCEPPWCAPLVEATLRAFVEQFYASDDEAEADEAEAESLAEGGA